MSDSVTILCCAAGRRATKLITGSRIDGYDAGSHFAVTERQITGIAALARVLDEVSRDPRSFVIRGEALPGIDRERCRRLLYKSEDGAGPTFREIPRRWAILDFDEVPGPFRFDPLDGRLAGAWCRALLPPAWHRVSYWWGLSSSAGFKPGLRLKLAFWLDRPCTGKELEGMLTGCPIDVSTLRPVQPIYVARPILVNVADPIRERTGLEEDADDVVPLPEPVAVAAPPPAAVGYVSGASASEAERRLDGMCRALERAAPGGRHRCLIWAAVHAVELDDAIPREVIAAELIAAARRSGLQDSDAELARQVRNGFRLGLGLGTEAVA